MPYEGPGIYQHHKGGHYRVGRVWQVEYDHSLMVAYSSLSLEHELERAQQGIAGILRPLRAKDGPDAFNELILREAAPEIGGEETLLLPRFRLISPVEDWDSHLGTGHV